MCFGVDSDSPMHSLGKLYLRNRYSKDMNILYILKYYNQHRCQVDTPPYNYSPTDKFDCWLRCWLHS